LHAEWTKLRTTPGTAWLAFAVVMLTVGVGATVRSVTAHGSDPTRLSLTGVDVGQAVVAVLAVLVISGEYGTGMIRTTLAAVPSRTTVLTAKAAVLTATVLATGAVAVLGSLLAGDVRPLTAGATVRAAVGSVLYLALIALLSLGIATAVRDAGAAVGTVLGLLYLFPLLAHAVSDPHWQRRLEQIAPMNAGQAVQTTVGLRALPIGPWQGLGVLAAWAAAALLAGGLTLCRRDA
jgi:ABC-2 type transport system permease protein